MVNRNPIQPQKNLPATERLVTKVESAWASNRWSNFNVLVAVSGGADSVGLLRTLIEMRSRISDQRALPTFVVAHFNHATRGRESNRDQAFVQQLAGEFGLECVVGQREKKTKESVVPDPSQDPATSPVLESNASEDNLRELRYEFLFAAARKYQARYIALGHHAQDQVETILFRMARGTGLLGLSGIPFTRVVDESITVVRPMLEVSSDLIREALREWKQDFREDASNESNDYARNFLRNEIVPAFRSRFENTFESAVIRLGKQAAQQQAFLRSQVQPLLGLVELNGSSATISCDGLLAVHIVLVRELLSEIWGLQNWVKSQMTFEHYDRIASLILDADMTEPGFHLPGKILCRKFDGQVVLSNV